MLQVLGPGPATLLHLRAHLPTAAGRSQRAPPALPWPRILRRLCSRCPHAPRPAGHRITLSISPVTVPWARWLGPCLPKAGVRAEARPGLCGASLAQSRLRESDDGAFLWGGPAAVMPSAAWGPVQPLRTDCSSRVSCCSPVGPLCPRDARGPAAPSRPASPGLHPFAPTVPC